jgi:hypothetical protein
MRTKVVNIYKEPYDVYIGRRGRGQEGYFGNPFYKGTREENIANYKKYFYNRLKEDSEFHARVILLKGKVLGCFCAPSNCHGDVIVEYLENGS